MVDGEIFDGKKDVILPKGIDNITIIRSGRKGFDSRYT